MFQPPLSTLRLFRLLLWVHWRSLLARLARRAGGSRRSCSSCWRHSCSATSSSATGCSIAGLNFLYHFPLVGTLLSQRILYLIFGFFFVMLVFSNLIIGYSTLFKNRETTGCSRCRCRICNVYRWKFLEALVGLELGADLPQRADDDRLRPRPRRGAGFLFSGRARLSAVRRHSRAARARGSSSSSCASFRGAIVKKIVSSLALGVVAAAHLRDQTDHRRRRGRSQQDVLSFDQLLRHTRLSVNPFLPSAWLAQSVLAWSEGLTRRARSFSCSCSATR